MAERLQEGPKVPCIVQSPPLECGLHLVTLFSQAEYSDRISLQALGYTMIWKQSNVPQWMNGNVVYMYNVILSGLKKKETLPFERTWMDL